jgi:hypothetical protein
MLQRQNVLVTTDGSGNASVKSDVGIQGYLVSIRYIKTDYADTVDFDIYHNDVNGTVLWNEDNVTASTVRQPRAPAHDQNGVVVAGALTAIPIIDPLLFVISNGGATKIGRFEVVIETP